MDHRTISQPFFSDGSASYVSLIELYAAPVRFMAIGLDVRLRKHTRAHWRIFLPGNLFGFGKRAIFSGIAASYFHNWE